MRPGVQVDATMDGYRDLSELRQRRDSTRVFELVAHLLPHVGTYVDYGCGTGGLIAEMRDHLSQGSTIVGIDASPVRVDACRSDFAHDRRTQFHVADLLDQLPDVRADLATMTAVLHWLHPREAEVVAAVAERMTNDATFVLTTYHPGDETVGLGGTDAVVAEALRATDRRDIDDRLARAALVPISRRTLPAEAIQSMLTQRFRNVDVDESLAETTAESGEQFYRYFLSTFGSYYLPLFASADHMADAVVDAANTRIDRLGYITRMPVRTWIAHRPTVTT